MSDKNLGYLLLIASFAGILIYGWLVLLSPWAILVLQVTAFLAVAGVLAILAWIGYTLATAPPPEPIPELETVKSEASKGQERRDESRES
ncbi:MAG: transcriptional regulator [Thaumarchaeota archaeon]|nr:transcriptional regulator [Candidatus Calditenuaceae archaeon]MDW8186600.1 transcriptional regulator [Nitrososphaerota archaeon]